ncbi:hypothetical protein [Zhenpiania hominis]|uniref:Uncharacterized protein n=1 Tax=Zhenpiania hominis TaxID=2763644 RepID=A0A923NH83_9FIRM|nr:hypothetical protein [Zhenpiania hominis]MBC6678369.1 hypothetical protein [Zhenpiania hominis]
MYYYPFHDLSVSALGIGSLRLPARPEDPNCIDREKAQKVSITRWGMASTLLIPLIPTMKEIRNAFWENR